MYFCLFFGYVGNPPSGNGASQKPDWILRSIIIQSAQLSHHRTGEDMIVITIRENEHPNPRIRSRRVNPATTRRAGGRVRGPGRPRTNLRMRCALDGDARYSEVPCTSHRR